MVQDLCHLYSKKNSSAASKSPTSKHSSRLSLADSGHGYLEALSGSPSGNNYILQQIIELNESLYIHDSQSGSHHHSKEAYRWVLFCYSPPGQLHFDQIQQFESQLLSEVCKILETWMVRTTSYHTAIQLLLTVHVGYCSLRTLIWVGRPSSPPLHDKHTLP